MILSGISEPGTYSQLIKDGRMKLNQVGKKMLRSQLNSSLFHEHADTLSGTIITIGVVSYFQAVAE